MNGRLRGRRVLVTSADRYAGPPVCELFTKEGAEVIADTSNYLDPKAPQRVIDAAGRVDVLVANFAGPLRITPYSKMLGKVQEFADEDFQAYLDEIVWPMVRFVRAVLPQMIERRSGKIVAFTSAVAVRAIPGLAVYSAARGAQNAFVLATGAEVAPHNVQFNAIAPSYLENVTYFTPAMLAEPGMRASLVANIPAGRTGEGYEAAELALSLATEASNFMAGQVISMAGGWCT
ncbi:SDR family NAD(P)-dependent oxidoreductase [Stigmatella erecta]|uniref:2-keto-3-deoxy-L-fuconate dehydrogenase n=1 Tax=Stigmatella erecta TaxID=83460 RepID=A0A1I0FNE6_9BACT|nr:SDR family oxidoreductase [Stigmatella erecta]SET59645.1 2-keto-3-deoxy-L-fuconate dehydrogenase [Stigmatella erecta]